MTFLPIAINIKEKKILIVGGGNVATKKVRQLLQYTKDITILAKDFSKELLEGYSYLKFIKKPYEKIDIDGYFLVYACTNDEKLNRKIASEAMEKGILVNVCDDPQNSDFISPAIYKNGDISIAVTSNAKDVKKSISIRNKIREFLENAGL